jgi:uncharacterized protein (TIGR03437 family)
LPVSLDGVRVSINNQGAFISYISPTQLNVLAPLLAATGSDSAVRVEVDAPDGTATASALMRAVAPGVFVFGGQNAAAVHADGSLVCAGGSVPGVACRPAKPGEEIELYVTGLGTDLDPVPANGSLMATPSVLLDKVTVSLGGMPCTVLYQGLISPGLYQINTQIPDVGPGDEPVVVSIDGLASQPGSIMAVAQ